MDRNYTSDVISDMLRRHLISRRYRLLEQIDFGQWDPRMSRELAMVDEALTRLGHFDEITT